MGSEVRIEIPTGVPNAKICVLGGTNLATSLTRSEEIEGSFRVETKFGASPEVFYGSVEDVPFYHIVLHGGEGADKSRRDFRVNSLLRTWSALHLLGVTEVLGGATAGAINSKFRDGDWVIPDDFIDFNVDRPPSIVADILGAEADKIWPRVNPATDPEIDSILYECSQMHADGVGVWKGGVLAQGPGSRFESVAEVRMMKIAGCDFVTASIPTEMIYARQLGIHYGSIVGISNPAEGIAEWGWDTLTNLYPRFHEQSSRIYIEAIPKVAALLGKPRIVDELRIHPDLEEHQL